MVRYGTYYTVCDTTAYLDELENHLPHLEDGHRAIEGDVLPTALCAFEPHEEVRTIVLLQPRRELTPLALSVLATAVQLVVDLWEVGGRQ
jgi:hypothetical protein